MVARLTRIIPLLLLLAFVAGVVYVVAAWRYSPARAKEILIKAFTVLNVALALFRQEEKLRAELLDTRHKLLERKVIERAKGLLMTHQGLTEEQAYQRLRGMAMNKKLKLADIAQRILDVEDLLG